LLNLYASGSFEQILRESGFQFAVAEYVIRTESLYVLKGGTGPDARDRVAVDLEPIVTAGLLGIVEITGEAEATSFLALATQLDDGEARTIAIASHRNWRVATDDRKAQKVAAASTPKVQALGTLEIIKAWAEKVNLSSGQLKSILINIRERGSFAPGKQDSLLAWWRANTAG